MESQSPSWKVGRRDASGPGNTTTKSTARRSVLLPPPPPPPRSAAPTSPPAATRLSAKEKPSEDAQLIPRRRPQFLRPFYKSTRRKRGSRCRPAADPRGSIALPAAEKRLLIPAVQRLFVPSSAGRARQRQRCPRRAPSARNRRRRRHGKEAKTERKARQAALDFTFAAVAGATQSGRCLFSPAAAAASLPLPRRRPLAPLVQGSLDRVLPAAGLPAAVSS